MDATTALQIATALASLVAQLAPLALEIRDAIQTNDQEKVDALLARLQAANDVLGKA